MTGQDTCTDSLDELIESRNTAKVRYCTADNCSSISCWISGIGDKITLVRIYFRTCSIYSFPAAEIGLSLIATESFPRLYSTTIKFSRNGVFQFPKDNTTFLDFFVKQIDIGINFGVV